MKMKIFMLINDVISTIALASVNACRHTQYNKTDTNLLHAHYAEKKMVHDFVRKYVMK